MNNLPFIPITKYSTDTLFMKAFFILSFANQRLCILVKYCDCDEW
jgi:hypothetical protein